MSGVVGSGDCGGTQIDRQTETETEEYMRSGEGRACAAGRSF